MCNKITDKHYDEYQNAKRDATRLHKIVERELVLYPIALSIGTSCFLLSSYYSFKENAYKKKYQFDISPSSEKIGLILGINLNN